MYTEHAAILPASREAAQTNEIDFIAPRFGLGHKSSSLSKREYGCITQPFVAANPVVTAAQQLASVAEIRRH